MAKRTCQEDMVHLLAGLYGHFFLEGLGHSLDAESFGNRHLESRIGKTFPLAQCGM